MQLTHLLLNYLNYQGDFMNRMRITTRKLLQMKKQKKPITMVTAYDFPTAKIVEAAGTDIILVGDSVGMVVLGYESTIYVTIEDMIHHTKAVTRGSSDSMVIADIPFVTAHLSREEVLRSAARLMQEGKAYGVKIEGGAEVVQNIHALTKAGIPVMGHLGLTPQSVNQIGGYFIQGKEKQASQELIKSAYELEAAGIFALVLECVPEELAEIISQSVSIPVIGIGAGRFCDGQVLVFHDILAVSGNVYPSFVKSYAAVGQEMIKGIESFVREVRNGSFPTKNHISNLPKETLQYLIGKGIEYDQACSNSI